MIAWHVSSAGITHRRTLCLAAWKGPVLMDTKLEVQC